MGSGDVPGPLPFVVPAGMGAASRPGMETDLRTAALALIPQKNHAAALAMMDRAARCLADPGLCPWCGHPRCAHFGTDPSVTCTTLARDSRPISPGNVQGALLVFTYKSKRRLAEDAIRAWVLRTLPWPEPEPIRWAHELEL